MKTLQEGRIIALVITILLIALTVTGCCKSGIKKNDVSLSHSKYHGSFCHSAQAMFSDSIQFHDPHGLKNLGAIRNQLVAEFGQEQVDIWLKHAIAEACLVKTDDGWAGAHVLQPDLPGLPSCSIKPSIHFTAEPILGMVWNNLEEFRRHSFDMELVIPRSDLVNWLKQI